MNPPIRMYLPRGHNLRSKIIETYSHLYNEWRRTHPGSSAYTVRQLNTNIRNAYSVIRQSFPETFFKLSTYAPWAANGWYEVYHSHWYFAVTFVTMRSGVVRAQIQDGIYEGYHHNDTMNTKPYESKVYKKSITLTESDLKYVISESVRRIIQEYTDHSIFGWEHAKKKFKDGGATDEVIKKLKDAYDVYAQERASQGRIPNDTGFDLWRSEKDLKSCEQGKGMMFPNYLD